MNLMKRVMIMNVMTEQNETFIEYVLEFYGKDGIYGFGATREDVIVALVERLESADEISFNGDFVDREIIRGTLVWNLGLAYSASAGGFVPKALLTDAEKVISPGTKRLLSGDYSDFTFDDSEHAKRIMKDEARKLLFLKKDSEKSLQSAES